MENQLYEQMRARFVKLYFTIIFLEDTMLPVNKVSAIRGGMGEMLLRMNCVRNRNCENCDFESECVVRRTMYSKFEIKPDFVTTGESIGYVLECEDRRTRFFEGDSLEFKLILFGKTIAYLNQFLQAFAMLGMYGLGREESRFQITMVKNTWREVLFDGNRIYMEQYRIGSICDYVDYRIQNHPEKWKNHMVFSTPLTLKYHNEFIQKFQMEPIINAVKRRIYMLNCFEGKENGRICQEFVAPEIVSQNCKLKQVDRYSARQGGKMTLKGIKGQLQLENIEEDLLVLFLAGELIHIGKNTSFGFGKYHIE